MIRIIFYDHKNIRKYKKNLFAFMRQKWFVSVFSSFGDIVGGCFLRFGLFMCVCVCVLVCIQGFFRGIIYDIRKRRYSKLSFNNLSDILKLVDSVFISSTLDNCLNDLRLEQK